MANITSFDPIREMVSLRLGSFSRSNQLPIRVESERSDAGFTDGVLTLRIPKSEEVRPRQIQINPGVAETSENGTGA